MLTIARWFVTIVTSAARLKFVVIVGIQSRIIMHFVAWSATHFFAHLRILKSIKGPIAMIADAFAFNPGITQISPSAQSCWFGDANAVSWVFELWEQSEIEAMVQFANRFFQLQDTWRSSGSSRLNCKRYHTAVSIVFRFYVTFTVPMCAVPYSNKIFLYQ